MPDTELGAVHKKMNDINSVTSITSFNHNISVICNTFLIFLDWKTLHLSKFSLNMAPSVKPFMILPIRDSLFFFCVH